MLIHSLVELFEVASVPAATRNFCARSLLKVLIGVSTYRPLRDSLKEQIGKESEAELWRWLRENRRRREFASLYWRAFGRFAARVDYPNLLGLPEEDLWYMLDILDMQDVDAFFTDTKRDYNTAPASDAVVATILKDVHKQIMTSAYKMLFVVKSDRSQSIEDMVAMLRSEALALIYTYDYLPYQHLLNTVRSGLWKFLSTQQRQASWQCRAAMEKDEEGYKNKMSPLFTENKDNGSLVDIPAVHGIFNFPSIDSDMDVDTLIEGIEARSRRLGSYLRAVVYGTDDPQSDFARWMESEGGGASVKVSDVAAAQKHYKITQRDITKLRALVPAYV